MHIRIYWKELGAHVHCRVFLGPEKHVTHALCGSLIFKSEEWAKMFDILNSIADVLPEP